MPESWISCYWHRYLKLYLFIYVDDCKLAGPVASLEKGMVENTRLWHPE